MKELQKHALIKDKFLNGLTRYWRYFPDLMEQKKALSLSFAGVVIVLYFGSVWWFSVNFPSWDDYYLLDFLNNYTGAGYSSKLQLLFSQHNEHRIVFCRLIFLTYLLLFKTINFKVLNFIGNLSLLGIFAVFINAFPKNTANKKWFFFSMALLLFSHGFWETSYMAMASLSNLWVMLFALLAIRSLSENNLLESVLYAVLAAFTSGGGLWVFVAGSLLCVSQKRYKHLFIYLFTMAVTFSIYLYHYVRPPQSPSLMFALRHLTHSVFLVFFYMGSDLGLLTLFAFPEAKYSGLLSGAWLGLVIFGQILFLTLKRYDRINPTVYFFLIYLLTVNLVVMLGRVGFEFFSALNFRYTIISVLFLVCVLISLADMNYFQSPRRVYLSVFACLFLNAAWFSMLYTNFNQCLWARPILFMSPSSYRDLSKPDFPYPEKARLILDECKNNGIYDFSKEFSALKP